MLWHAVRAICVPPVEHVFVVLAPEDRAFSRHDWSAFAGKLEPLYCGGGTRRDSVYNGLVAAMAAVDADDWMLVHDAARPCRSEEHTSELQSQSNLVCRLLLEKKNLHLMSHQSYIVINEIAHYRSSSDLLCPPRRLLRLNRLFHPALICDANHSLVREPPIVQH